jgi:TM2 domain-containing membrane protein YozV
MYEFSVGGVISDTVQKFTRRFGLHFVYALLPALLAGAVSYLAAMRTTAEITTGTSPALAMFGSPLYWIALLVGILCSCWGITGIVASMLQSQGRPLTFADMASISIANIAKFLLLYIIWYVGIVIGMILLVIPGLILLTMWAAAIPAMVDGRLGPWQALGESARLTKGKRLRVFATLVILMIVMTIPSGILLSTFGMGDAMSMLQQRQSQPLFYSGISLVTSSLFTVVLAAYLSALFERLNGGVSPALAETFA